VAVAIAREIDQGGGYVTREDLAGYHPRLVPPAQGRFRGLSVYSSTPPGGGVTLLQMLHILDRFPPAVPCSPETVVLMVEAMREAFAERRRTLGDPDFVPIPVDALIGRAWADAAADRIRAGTTRHVVPMAAAGGTTHVSVCDTHGNAVALTHTLGLYSGVMVPGTGVALNSAMDNVDPVPDRPNSIAPGKARLSAMAPTLVLEGGRLRLVNGSPGTNAIATSMFQVIVGVIDHGLDAAEAVAAPRAHCEGGPVFVEGRVTRAVQAALSARGFEVRPLPGNYVASLGRNQLIVVDASGRGTGASDPRRDGGVAAYAPA
jgi:gamma-glutamyltranspeptidase/glutathione hydrolase